MRAVAVTKHFFRTLLKGVLFMAETVAFLATLLCYLITVGLQSASEALDE